MPEGPQATVQFHVRCKLRAFRLTKSITQRRGACASHPHNTHCFCLSLLDGPNTHLLIGGRSGAAYMVVHFTRLQLLSGLAYDL